MPRDGTLTSSLSDRCERIADAADAALQFVPPDRAEAIMRKWIPRDAEGLAEERMLAMMADALLLSADLLPGQPSASGATAYDRLARSRAGAPPAEAAAIAALCKARFRLLRLEGDSQAPEVEVRDALSDEALRIVGADFPKLAAGTHLFGRAAMLGEGFCCLPGAVTPLDPAAVAAARGHPAAGAPGAAAGARWAEAVYAHVVRHGTLDVPGLNRPSGDFEPDDDPSDAAQDELMSLAAAWMALEGAAPDAALLHRTRRLTDLPSIACVLSTATTLRGHGDDGLSLAFERIALVQLETVKLREQSGSGSLTLDAIGRDLDDAIAAGVASAAVRTLFETLRRRLGGSAGRGRGREDPELERLVGRIQALRAKTVARGCTEQEALAAAEKVAELLDRYGLTLGELEVRDQPCDGIGIQTDRRRSAPVDSCVPAIAAFFDCRAWIEQPPGMPLRHIFFGMRADVTAAQYLYELVEQAFETETDAFRAGPVYARLAGRRRTATNSFQIGLARGIRDKLAALRAARDASRGATGRDLVPVKAAVVEEEMAKLGLALRTRGSSRGSRILPDAFREGQAAGARFEFAPAITRTV